MRVDCKLCTVSRDNSIHFWHTTMILLTFVDHDQKRTSTDFGVKRSKFKVKFEYLNFGPFIHNSISFRQAMMILHTCAYLYFGVSGSNVQFDEIRTLHCLHTQYPLYEVVGGGGGWYAGFTIAVCLLKSGFFTTSPFPFDLRNNNDTSRVDNAYDPRILLILGPKGQDYIWTSNF